MDSRLMSPASVLSRSVHFLQLRQGLMETDTEGGEVFIGAIDAVFGIPLDGTQFDALVKLSVGASFRDDAYEVSVAPALARLGARPDFWRAAHAYVHQCMSSILGPHWALKTGLTASNNLMQMDVPLLLYQLGRFER